MSTKRQPSKQRRQTQNQRQRAALEARRSNAAASGEMADGKAAASASTSGSGGGSVFSRLRGARTTGRSIRAGASGKTQPPGYQFALSGLLAAIAAAVAGALLIPVAVDSSGDQISSRGALVGEWTLSAWDVVQENPDATPEEVPDLVEDWMPSGEEPYGKAAWPLSLGLILPVIGAGLAFRAVSKRSPAKVVNRAMYVTLFGSLLTGQLIFIFLPAVIGVGIAAFQVRKAEMRAAAAAADDAAVDDAEVGADDEVIDVDEVIDAEEAVEGDQLIEAEATEDVDEEVDEAEVIADVDVDVDDDDQRKV